MTKLQYQDFLPKDSWLIFRLDTQVADKSADVYMLMELPCGEILSSEVTIDEELTPDQLQDFLQKAYAKKGYWPKKVLVLKNDPIENALKELSLPPHFKTEPHPASTLEDLIAPVKESFGEFCFSPSSLFYSHARDDVDADEIESAKQSIPDTYAPCPCASGKKYKFCCKPIFREIIGAMAEAEEGRKSEALKFIQEAKKRVGETAEVLCREAIVHSFFDEVEFDRLLIRCLDKFPNHPRGNYIKGLNLRMKGRFPEAITFYKKAIDNYPKTDRFHLNEAYNNIGTVYYELKKYKKAKESWEQALFLLPSDRMVKHNLHDCIYTNPSVPEKMREISPMVAKLFEKKIT
jgi:hypothetical protein